MRKKMTHKKTNSGTKDPCLLFLWDKSLANRVSDQKRIKKKPDSLPFSSQGLFAEYIELLVQFGYLSLFSCVFPLTAVLLLLNNVTEIRSDAYKICKLFRKPFYPPVANMGVWQVSTEHNNNKKNGFTTPLHRKTFCVSDCLWDLELCLCCVQLLAAAAVATRAGVGAGERVERRQPPLDGRHRGGRRWRQRAMCNHGHSKCDTIVLCFQHVLFLVKFIIAVVIPDEPYWIRKKREHMEYASMWALRQMVSLSCTHLILKSGWHLFDCFSFSFFQTLEARES